MAKKRTKRLTDQVRQAMDECGETRYRIAKETGISETSIGLFYNGHRGLSLKAFDRLCDWLQIEIVAGRKPKSKGK
jgi:hypothetical protein